MRYITFVTKGLEQVAKLEIEERIPDAVGVEVGNKRIIFATDAPLETLTSLRTVDDICLLVGTMSGLTSVEDVLAQLASIELGSARDFIGRLRNIENSFSVTPTVVGLKSTTSQQLADLVAGEIGRHYRWVSDPTDHSRFDVRIFIEQTDGYVGVRLTEQSLMHRSYKVESKPGSLRPTVAAAMIRLAAVSGSSLRVVDNFCGSGTILCEALLAGHSASGGDIDSESVRIARNNLSRLRHDSLEEVRVLDATKPPWRDDRFDVAVSNLPWGKQVPLTSVTFLYDKALKEYARIVKRPGVVSVLVSKPELLVKYARKHLTGADISTTRVSFTGQTPTIVTIRREQ